MIASTGTPVCEDYKVPFRFKGEIKKVTITLADHKPTEEELEEYRQGRVRAALSR